MTLYRKRPILVDLEVFDGTPESISRLAEFVGDSAPSENPPTLAGIEPSTSGPRLKFRYRDTSTLAVIEVGGAIARDRDGKGYYPIGKAALEATFELVGDPPPDEVPLDAELEAALERVAGELA